MRTEKIYISLKPETIFIKTIGHITARSCCDFRKLVFEAIEKNDDLKSIIIDLSESVYMDSTFMGLIVGFNKAFNRKTSHSITILRPTEECVNLLTDLGIIHLLHVSNENIQEPDDMMLISDNSPATAELLYNAHDNLMELSDINRKRFKELHQILRKKLDNKDEN